MTQTEIINLSLSLITAISAGYLAYAALVHSARPRAKVLLLEPKKFIQGEVALFKFCFKNAGHWYSKPMIINMKVFINFDHQFEPRLMRYGSMLEITNDVIKNGKGKMKYMRAKGIILSYGESEEEVHVIAKNPSIPGEYKIKISAFSENGLNLSKDFNIIVTNL